MRKLPIVPVFVLIMYLSAPSLARDTIQKRIIDGGLSITLLNIQAGSLVRVISVEQGRLEGQYLTSVNDSLYLTGRLQESDPDKMNRLERRRMHRATVMNLSDWRKVQEKTVIPLNDVNGLWVRGNAIETGAIVGGSIAGLVSILFGYMYVSTVEGENKADIGKFFIGSTLAGGFIGAIIGSGTTKWHREY